MKIVLILPYDSTYRFRDGSFTRSILYPPLTLTLLAALVPEELNAVVRIVDEGVEELPEDLDADIVGISACTATAPRAYFLADKIRAGGIPVVLGGVHPTVLPQEAAEHADCVVIGFAEKSWPRLLRDFQKGQLRKYYDDQPETYLAGLPHPRRDLLKKDRYLTTQTIMATRGCPNTCHFCAVPVARRLRYYKRPVEEVVREMRSMEGGPFIFLDPSPTEDLHYTKSLYEAMIPLQVKWVGLSTVKIAENDELLSLAVRSGCRGLLMGFETISQASLRRMSKGFNQVKKYQTLVRKLHDYGIGVMACIILGFDEDDPSVFERTLEFVNKVKIDLVRYTIFTPFPGTAVYQELTAGGRILHHDWDKYDYEHAVFQPARMTPEQLQNGLSWLWTHTYSLKSIMRRTLFHPHLPWVTVPASFSFRHHSRRLVRYYAEASARDLPEQKVAALELS